MEQGKCRSCGAAIRWVRTAFGLLAIDPEPAPGGEVVVVDGDGVVLKGYLFEKRQDPRAVLYRKHSCPEATKHRKRK